jgi:CobQ-like glutamine amidotransferase family enzyme
MKKQIVRHAVKISEKKVIGSYEMGPFFLKKNEEVKQLLLKVGLPKDFKVKHDSAS